MNSLITVSHVPYGKCGDNKFQSARLPYWPNGLRLFNLPSDDSQADVVETINVGARYLNNSVSQYWYNYRSIVPMARAVTTCRSSRQSRIEQERCEI